MTPPPDPIAHLRIERRSYILGTLLVLGVVVAASFVLLASMIPGVFSGRQPTTVTEVMAQLSNQQHLILQALNLVGGIALFFLNLRFSLLLLRPRWAYVSRTPGVRYSNGRWGWWAVLTMISLFPILQLVATPVLAHLGTVEIRLRQEMLRQPPPSGDEPPVTPS